MATADTPIAGVARIRRPNADREPIGSRPCPSDDPRKQTATANDPAVALWANGVAAHAGALETSMALLDAQMTDKMKDAKHWRDRAAEIRARAIAMEDGVSRRVMLSIAQSYEVLAQRAQEVANRSDNTAHED
jgi:hypothetical protein